MLTNFCNVLECIVNKIIPYDFILTENYILKGLIILNGPANMADSFTGSIDFS